MDNFRILKPPEDLRHEGDHIGIIPELRDPEAALFQIRNVFFHEHFFFRGKVYGYRSYQLLHPGLFHFQNLLIKDSLVSCMLVNKHKVFSFFGKDIQFRDLPYNPQVFERVRIWFLFRLLPLFCIYFSPFPLSFFLFFFLFFRLFFTILLFFSQDFLRSSLSGKVQEAL